MSLLLALVVAFCFSVISAFAASGITASGTDNGNGTGVITLMDAPGRGVEILYVLSKDGVIQTPDPQAYSGPIQLTTYGTWSITYAYADKTPEETSDVFQQTVMAQVESSQENSSQESSSRENSSQESSSQEDNSQESSSQEDSFQESSSQEDNSQESSSQEDYSQESSLQDNSLQPDNHPPATPAADAPVVTHTYDWKTDKVTLDGATGTSYGITNKASLTVAELKTMQSGSTSYSSAFTLNSSAAMMYIYVWPTKLEEDTNNYAKISINTQPPIPQVSYSFNHTSKTITLSDDASTDGPLYYVASASDPGASMPDNAMALLYGVPIDAKAGNWNYVTVWHSMIPAFKDRGVTLRVQTNSPKPGVTINVNDSTKEVALLEAAPSGLPLYYWYDDGSGLNSNEDQQAASVEYTGGFYINPSFATRDIKVWYSQDPAYADNYTELSYYRDQAPPSDRISFDLTYDGSSYKLSISGTANLPYKLYYTVKEGSDSASDVRDYTAALTLTRDRTYAIEAFYSNNGGVSHVDTTSFTVTIDAEGNFNTLNADKNLKIVARGSFLYFTGPSSTCEYTVRVFNPDTNANYYTFTKDGAFDEEEVRLPEGAAKYQVEYTVKEAGKLKAVNKGTPVSVDATYMPEPYNLKWNAVTMTATADMSRPANVIEFELYNTDYNTSYQKNTTGVFTNVPSGRYELRAVAYNSENEDLRSTTTKIRITIDKDPPTLSLIPITMAGSIPGVIVTATDLGSGINRVEVSINGKQQPNIKSGDTVYAVTEGDNAIKVIAYDNMGNETADSVTVNFDKKLLNPTIDIPEDVVDDDGKPREWWNSKVTVNVSAANAATKLQYLTLSNDSKMLKMETKNPPEGSITLSYDIETDGVYNLIAQAMSPGGIQSGGDAKRTVKIDTKAPDKPEISVGDDGSLTITSKDSGSGIDYIKYQISGKPEEEYTEGIKVKGDGEISIVAVAYDKAGNASESNTAKVKVFTEPPTEPTINGVGVNWVTSEEPVIVTITPGTNKNASDNKITTKYLIGSETRSGTGWQTYKEGDEIEVKEEGITKISAYSKDSYDNESDVVVGYVKIDYSAPSMRAVATSPFDSNTTRTSFKLHFKDEGSGIDKIFVGINGNEKRLDLKAKHRAQGYVTMTVDLPPVNSNANVEASTDDGDLDEATYQAGAHVVFFRALDKAGNESKIELISDHPGNQGSSGSGTNTPNKTNPGTGDNN